MITKITIVETIKKIFDHAHDGSPGRDVGAPTEGRPIGGPGALDRVVASISQEWEQDRKAWPWCPPGDGCRCR